MAGWQIQTYEAFQNVHIRRLIQFFLCVEMFALTIFNVPFMLKSKVKFPIWKHQHKIQLQKLDII